MQHLLKLCIFLTIISSIDADLVFETPTNFGNGTILPTFSTPPILFAVREFNITAPLLYLDSYGCNSLGVDATGMIVAVKNFGGCFTGRKLQVAQEAGAIGLLIEVLSNTREGDTPGVFARFPPDAEGPFEIPAVQISFRFGLLVHDLLLQNEAVTVTITPSENLWIATFDSPGFIFFQVFFAAVFLGILGVSLWKYSVVVKTHGWKPTILHVFVWVEIVNSALRFLYFLDPMQSRGFYSFVPAFLFGTVHIPFTYIAAVLIALYWMETVSDYVSVKPKSKWLTKMAIPFYLFMAFVLISYAAYIAAEFYGLASSIIQAIILVNFVFIAFASIFILVVGAKVLHFARKMSERVGVKRTRNRAVRMMTIKLILSGVGMIIMLILSPLLGASSAAETFGPINAWLALIIEQFTCLALVSLAQLFTIQGKKKFESHETKSGSKPSVSAPRTSTLPEEVQE